MKDFLGKEINVGDKIIATSNQYNEFLRGNIIKITPKMVFIKLDKAHNHHYYDEVKRFPYQIIVI